MGTGGDQTTAGAQQPLWVRSANQTVDQGTGIHLAAIGATKETAAHIAAVNTSGANGDLVFYVYNGGATYPEYMRIKASGNVGIGTTSPTYKFMVSDNTNAVHSAYILQNHATGNGLYVDNSGTSSANYALRVASGVGQILSVINTGHVGIGLTNPNRSGFSIATVLSIKGLSSAKTAALELIGNTLTSPAQIGTLAFVHDDSGTPYELIDLAAALDGAVNSGCLQIWTMNGGSSTEKIRITKEGNLGIGTTSPGAKLDVAGGINSTSLTDNYIPKHVSDTSGLADSRVVNTYANGTIASSGTLGLSIVGTYGAGGFLIVYMEKSGDGSIYLYQIYAVVSKQSGGATAETFTSIVSQSSAGPPSHTLDISGSTVTLTNTSAWTADVAMTWVGSLFT